MSLHAIVSRSEFRHGLDWGIACTAAGAAVGMFWRFRFRRPAPIAGLLITLAFVEGARRTTGLPHNVTNGLVVLVVAGFAAELLSLWWRPLALTGIVFAIPGAVMLTSHSGVPDVTWIRGLVVVTVAVGGTLVADFDRRYRAPAWSVVLFAISVGGLYYTVPDTERALVLLGACVPLMLLGWPVALASLGTTGSYAAVGALAWVAAFEGVGRRSAIIGGVACLGLFVVEPLVRLLKLGAPTMFDKMAKSTLAVVPVAAAHAALVAGASRLAGLRPTVRQAGWLAVADLGVGLVVVMLVDGEVSRIRPGRGRVVR
jgi:hypothetical protein